MADTLTSLGELSLLDLMPGVVAPLIAAQADLQARITALLGFSATVGLDMSQLVTLSANILANLQAGLALGLQAPSLTVQINLVVALTATLQAQLQLILNLMNLLAASVSAWVYDGNANGFGSLIDAAFTTGFGPTQHVNALVFATQYPEVWAAVAQVFRTTP
jgi:hypothetical protein